MDLLDELMVERGAAMGPCDENADSRKTLFVDRKKR
jgi:hypothetical protein